MLTHNSALMSMLTDLKRVGGPLELVRARLIKDNFVPGPSVTLPELEAHEADFNGYAASPNLVWLAPYIGPSGEGKMSAQDVQFRPTDSAVPNTIYSYWLESGVAPNIKVLSVTKLLEPATLVTIYDALQLDVDWVIPQGSA
jgi:hypothetical protein